MLRTGIGAFAGTSLAGSVSALIAALQAQATDVPSDTRWLWFTALGLFLLAVVAGLAWALMRDESSDSSRKASINMRGGKKNTATINQNVFQDTRQVPRPQTRYIPVPIPPPDELIPTTSVRTEVFGIPFVCKGRYKLARTLKIEAQCPDHTVRLSTRGNRYPKEKLDEPNDDDDISNITRDKHLHCPVDGGHRLYFRLADSERTIRMTSYREARVNAEALLEKELETPADSTPPS